MKSAIFLVDGFEETEAATTIDVLRRGGVSLDIVSLTGDKLAVGAHGVSVVAELLFEEADESYEMLILPGGGGYVNYEKHAGFVELLKKHASEGKKVSAICAAPTVLGSLGMLEGKKAVCFPGMEDGLKGAEAVNQLVVKDGNIITSIGPASSLLFGLAALAALKGEKAALDVAKAMQVDKLGIAPL